LRVSVYCFFALLLVASCVPNRKHLYLQKSDLHTSQKLNEVLRQHPIDTFNYRVQPNDILSVRFESLTPKNFDFLTNQGNAQMMNMGAQGNPLLFGELVDEQGNISLPGLGPVYVAGLTVFDIQEKLKSEAGKFVESPVVRVRLLNYRVTVLGEVNKEGTITLQNNRASIMEALGLAGGLNDFADKSMVKLIRQKGNMAEVVYLNLLDEELIHSPYYYVHQNDVLIIPPLKQRPFRKYFNQNLSLFLSALTLGLLIVNLN